MRLPLLPVTFALIAAAAATAIAPLAARAEEPSRLSPAEVVRVMVSRRAQIRKLCYDEATPKVDASMRVDFDIAPNGVVTGAKASSLNGPATVASCVVGEMKRTIFPESEAGGHFRWPFIFKEQ